MHEGVRRSGDNHRALLKRQGGRQRLVQREVAVERRLRAGNPEIGRTLIGHGEEPTDTPGDGILGHRRIGQRSKLLQARLMVVQAQAPGFCQVRGHVVAEDLEGASHPRPGCDVSPSR